MIKGLLAVLGVWSAGCGFYFGLVGGNKPAFLIGLGLAGLLIPVALVLAIAELPVFIRRRNRN